jgi:transcriptional regulator with XRE-family HTH domain
MVRTIKSKIKKVRTPHLKKKEVEQVSSEVEASNFVIETTTPAPDFARPILENSFKEYTQRQRLSMHYSLAEIADKLGVREEHLQLLEEEGLNRFLPEIYVYSILRKYCNFLHLDYEQALKLYKNEVTNIRLPGEGDPLASFKTNITRKINLNYKKLVIFFLLLVVLVFGAYQTDMLIGKPSLTVNGLTENMQVTKPFINMTGKVSRTKTLLFNGQEIFLDNSQTFEIDNYNLTDGWNTLKFEAYNHLGRVTTKEYHVEFTSTGEETTTTTETTLAQ